jgi:FKBP-type peptidyl-prolyl cis-trans isomerase
MRKNSVWVMAAVVMISITSCRSTKNASTASANLPISLNTPVDSACYSVGVNYGVGLRENMKTFPGGEANIDAIAEGFLRAIKGDSAALVLTPEAAQAYIQSYIAEIQVKETSAEKERGERFLVENKTKEGVITTESGLQYKILKQGDGAKPVGEDQVLVHYTGKLLDGTVFDSSVQRGEPLTIGVGQVIRGWTELLQLMPTGSKYQAWIPSDLAYGEQGAGQMIRPNTTIEFEVELLDIVKEQ